MKLNGRLNSVAARYYKRKARSALRFLMSSSRMKESTEIDIDFNKLLKIPKHRVLHYSMYQSLKLLIFLCL